VQESLAALGRIIYRPAIKNDSSAILRFFELALVFVHLNDIAAFIGNANQCIM
jgi:hypothetical protein